MRLWTLVCGLAATFVVSISAQAAGPWLLTLNKTDLMMTMVDPATRQVVASLPSGPDPHEIVASPDGRLAYITNYTAGNGAENTITVIDLVARKALAPIDLGSLSRPHGLHFAAGKLYFSAEGSKVVGRIDPATRKIEWVQGSGQSRTHMVLTTSDGGKVFTTNIGSASVSIFEPAGAGRGAPARGGAPAAGAPTGRLGGAVEWNVFVVPVGRGAEGFDLTPDGKELWTANAQEASVSIIDVAARTATNVPVAFTAANRLKFTPDGKLALISDIQGHELIVMDVATRKEHKRIEVKAGAAGTLITPDGSKAYLSVGPQNAVAEIDLKTLTVTNWIATGRNPDGLAWAERVR